MLFTSQKHVKYNKSSGYDRYHSSIIDLPDNRKITESGILLLQGIDPISRLFSYITRQQYTLIGTYYIYNNSEDEIIDINYIFNGDKPIWASDIRSNNELILSNCVSKIIKYPFITPTFIELKTYDYSIRSSLVSLFNHDFVMMEGIKKVIKYLYPDLNIPSIVNEISPIEILLTKSAEISFNNINITNIDTDVTVNNYKAERNQLGKIISTFIDMVLSDPNFLDLVAKKYFTKVYSYDLLHELILQYTDIHIDTILLIKKWISTSGKIDKKDIDQLITRVNKINNTSNEQYEKIDDVPTDLIVIDRTPSDVIIRSVYLLKTQLRQIVSMLEQKCVPYIELNSIISSVNELSEYYKLGDEIPVINKPSSGLIVISPEKETAINLTLKSGNELILTTRNLDLTNFTRSELVEILEYIDKLIIDDRYDTIRTKISKEISCRES
jgi:hypothetical protein